MKQRYRWAVMDTFDMLTPEYDEPLTMAEAKEVLTEVGIEDIHRTSYAGLCIDGVKTEGKPDDESFSKVPETKNRRKITAPIE